jgi:mannosyl-oligosaccharide alpha-1,2-mannosidase
MPAQLSRRAFIGAAAGAGVALAAGRLPTALAASPNALRPDLAEDCRNEFLATYRSYLAFAGDRDELHPISRTGSDFFASGHPVRLTVIESLDTLYLMEADEELADGIDFVVNDLSFDIDASFQVFETIIRVVGGLLSGYHASGHAGVLAQARDLADRLMPAFEQSPTGMPWRFVNLHTGAVSGSSNVLAEIGTCVTEFGDLTRFTGDPKYLNAAKAAQKAVFDRRSGLDLVGTQIDIQTGAWQNSTSTMNPPVDSFFEYLWEGFFFLGDRDDLSMYRTLITALLARQSVTINKRLWFSSNNKDTGITTSTTQSELAAFAAGMLGQSGFLKQGADYHDSWADALHDGGYRILPEGLGPGALEATSRGNQLRPEYVDSAFTLWLQTGKRIYVDRAAEYYENQRATCRVADAADKTIGYTILTDVTTRPETQGDLASAYWYSENMKYYFLMFGRSPRFTYARDAYLTTEGNVLRGLL